MSKDYAYLVRVGLALAAFAIFGFAVARPGSDSLAYFGVVAIAVLLELPAVVWRMRGGAGHWTWLIAILVPLIIFEGLMGFTAYANRHETGEFKDVEIMLMIYIIPPLVLVTATLVTLFAVVRYPRER